jgi:hypothetical protein
MQHKTARWKSLVVRYKAKLPDHAFPRGPDFPEYANVSLDKLTIVIQSSFNVMTTAGSLRKISDDNGKDFYHLTHHLRWNKLTDTYATEIPESGFPYSALFPKSAKVSAGNLSF